MKKGVLRALGRAWVPSVFLVSGLCGGVAFAQAPRQESPPAREVLRVRRFPKPGKHLLVRTPEFNTSMGRSVSSRRPREWMLHETIYETLPEWVDSLDFAYSIMTERRAPDGKREFNLFQASVRYLHLAEGEHTACVALPPQALARYGEPVAIALEISLDGKLLDTRNEVKIDGLPDDWWKNARVLDNPGVVRRPGYLVDRSKTPFALIHIDDYEMVK